MSLSQSATEATDQSITSFFDQLFRTAESDLFTFTDISMSMVVSTLLTFVDRKSVV